MVQDDPAPLVDIRVAGVEDAWAVGQLFGALHAFNSELDERFELADGWQNLLADHLEHTQKHQNGINLLAWQGSEPIGLIMMDGHTDSPIFKHRHWAELVALYVDPTVRSSGVAARLLDAGLAWAHHHGYERIQLYVTASNIRAKRFYERAGFHIVQEIWRIEMADVENIDIYDDICESEYAQGVNLLSIHQHKLTPENPLKGD